MKKKKKGKITSSVFSHPAIPHGACLLVLISEVGQSILTNPDKDCSLNEALNVTVVAQIIIRHISQNHA